MLADPAVMQDLGGTVDRAAADAKLDRYVATLAQGGPARLAVTGHDGGFRGYAGVMPREPRHPAG
ncbi:MAG: hypothetical protein RIG56_22380, partial [Thalassobaculum sp.]